MTMVFLTNDQTSRVSSGINYLLDEILITGHRHLVGWAANSLSADSHALTLYLTLFHNNDLIPLNMST